MTLNRRDVLRAGIGVASLAVTEKFLVSRVEAAQLVRDYTLPKLPYPVDALEPHIDARTMEIHHGKHHAAYVENVNKALANHPELKQKDPVTLIRFVATLPDEIRQAVINNGGGHVNHSLFWNMMAPNAGGEPSGEVGNAIDRAFGSFDVFKAQFADAAMKRFGSGWAWLVAGNDGKLSIISTANQDSPFMQRLSPILGLDVWEHAYYLKYQNRRADYVSAWWNVVNWDYVHDLYRRARS